MNMMMLFAAMGAKTQQTVTFTANTTWVAPVGVTLLPTVVGHGSNGSSPRTSSTVVTVTYHSTGTAGVGSILWENVQGVAEGVAANLNASGSISFDRYVIQVYPDETNTYTTSTPSIEGYDADATFTGGWGTSGHISSSGTSRVSYTHDIDGTAATGFSKTFPGGVSGGVAPTTSFTNVAVVPGNSYPVVVPTGGAVQITYFA